MSYMVFADGIGEISHVTRDWLPPEVLVFEAKMDAVLNGVPPRTPCWVRQNEENMEFLLLDEDFITVGEMLADGDLDWDWIDSINPDGHKFVALGCSRGKE